jgi:uncharacterized protein (DUF697 family)
MEKKFDPTMYLSRLFEDIDEDRVRMNVENLRDEFPEATSEALCQKSIDREAMTCGIMGAFTGALPFPWSILGSAPDLIVLIYRQSTMVLSIAHMLGFEPDVKERAAEVLGCIGASVGAVAGTYGIKKVVERRTEALLKALMKQIIERLSLRIGRRFIPIIGAIGGAFFNYGSAQAVGNAALNYYRTKIAEGPAPKTDEEAPEFVEDVKTIEEQPEKRAGAGEEQGGPIQDDAESEESPVEEEAATGESAGSEENPENCEESDEEEDPSGDPIDAGEESSAEEPKNKATSSGKKKKKRRGQK